MDIIHDWLNGHSTRLVEMTLYKAVVVLSGQIVPASDRSKRTAFLLLLLLSVIVVFLSFNPHISPYLRTQILAYHDTLYSIDTIFESRYHTMILNVSDLSLNSTGKRVPQGYILRQIVYQKVGTLMIYGNNRTNRPYSSHTGVYRASLPSPYILPSQWSIKGEKPNDMRRTQLSKNTKLIGFFNRPSWLRQDLTFDQCEVTDCRLVGRLGLRHAHAVVFSAPDLPFMDPPARPHGQRWVYYNLESPYFTNNVTSSPQWRHQFNWTMTYRRDSDIFLPYAFFQEREVTPVKDYESVVRQKTRLVTAFISNCKTASKRMDYIRELQKYIQVDIYGKCGPLACYSRDHWECLDVINTNYKFYLAFENSFCLDYVTEKLTKLFRDVNVIPIVRGGADYNNILPNSTFINTAWFSTPGDLARHITGLDEDEHRYTELLRRKDRFVEADPLPFQRAFCDLCHRLHQTGSVQYYDDVSEWFSHVACHEPTDV